MTSASIVRLAVPEDRQAVIAMISLLHDENGLFPLSARKVTDTVDRYYRGENSILGVIGPPGNIEGSIYLSIDEPYYSDSLQLCELWNVVHPDHRRSTHAKALIEFAKRCSNEVAIPLMIGVISNHRTAEKIRLYSRQLTPVGAFFVHNPHFAGGNWATAAE